MPAVSIIVPTYDRWHQLELVLAALAAQTLPEGEREVVVVSDGSTDGTDEALSAGRAPVPVVLVRQSNQGAAAARNAGVEAATGDLILFIDDDVVAAPECAAVHLEAHERRAGPTVVVGPLLTPDDVELEPWVRWEQTMLYKQYNAMARGDWEPTARQFYTGNASLRRDRFLAAGGFDASFRRGEDVELAYRLNDAGVSFAFEFRARAFHHARRSFHSWLANATAYGRNDAVLWRDRGQRWLLPTVRAELEQRHPLTRLYTRLGLRSARVGTAVTRLVAELAAPADRLGLDGLAQGGLSAVYNLAYYRGVIEELGGREAFAAIEPVAARGDLHGGPAPEAARG